VTSVRSSTGQRGGTGEEGSGEVGGTGEGPGGVGATDALCTRFTLVLLMVIDEYFIDRYWWLFKIKLS